jgi:hypothetical protein
MTSASSLVSGSGCFHPASSLRADDVRRLRPDRGRQQHQDKGNRAPHVLALVTGEPGAKKGIDCGLDALIPQLKAPGSIDEQHAACHPSSASFWDSAGLPRWPRRGPRFALRYRGRKRAHNADEIMAEIVGKRLVEHLERASFVVMKRSAEIGGRSAETGLGALFGAAGRHCVSALTPA